MTDHLGGNVDGDVFLAVMDEQLEADKVGEDGASASGGPDGRVGLEGLGEVREGGEVRAFPRRPR